MLSVSNLEVVYDDVVLVLRGVTDDSVLSRASTLGWSSAQGVVVVVGAAPSGDTHIADAAVGGLGIAYLPEDEFAPHLEEGRLIRVLEDWCEPFSGYHLYYPSRRQPSPAFALVLEALRLTK